MAATLALSASVVMALTVGTASAPAAKTPYKVMVIVGINTVLSNDPAMGTAAQAAADEVNKTGGIGGRQVVVDVCNHQGTAAGTQSCAQTAVADHANQVFCLCSFTNYLPILDGANIPRFGSFGSTVPELTDSRNFFIDGGPTVAWLGAPFALKRKGVKAATAVGVNVSGVTAITNLMGPAAKVAGISFGGLTSTPVGSTDFSTTVQQVKDKNAQGIILLISPATFGAFLNTANQLGLKETYVPAIYPTGDPELKAYGNLLNGMVGFSPVPQIDYTSFPIVKEFLSNKIIAAKKKAGICCRAADLSVYSTIFAIQALAKKVKGSVTNKSLMATANDPKTGTIQFGGIYSWQPWKKGGAAFPRIPDASGWFVKYQNGKIVLDGPRKPTDISKVLRAE